MRLSQFFLPVLRDDPKEAEIVSHQLMLRAGMIRQAAPASIPGCRWASACSRRSSRSCARSRTGPARIEMLMPTIQSAELWRESGRYDDYGAEMLRIKDRHDREMLYGPTNEEHDHRKSSATR